jgi:transcriptional regulator with XRE-family HTH domain
LIDFAGLRNKKLRGGSGWRSLLKMIGGGMGEGAKNEVTVERRGKKGRATALDVFAGRRLREARLESRMTQEELARQLGLTFQAIQKYESGENRLSVGRLVAAAKVLQKPISYFVPEDDGGATDAAAALTSEEAELVGSFRRIKRGDARDSLLTLARQFTDIPRR